MSDDIMIPVERLGKKYIIGHQRELNATLRDVLAAGRATCGARRWT
jgi:hypothetical protein